MMTAKAAVLVLIAISMGTVFCLAEDKTNGEVHTNSNRNTSHGNKSHGKCVFP